MITKGDRLRVVVEPLARAKGFNQTTLHAAMLRADPSSSVARGTVTNYWRGQLERVDLDIVDLIADVLGVNVLELFVRVPVGDPGDQGVGAADDPAALRAA